MLSIPAYVVEEAIDKYLIEVYGEELFWSFVESETNLRAIKLVPMFKVEAEDQYGEVKNEN